jgi:1-acyl-sn-glycerol-3-phosphate acyltransferase
VIGRILRTAPRAAFGAARMADVIVRDIAGALVGRGQGDPLAARDPEYTRQTLPALELFSTIYHRGEVEGLENIPEEGPVLLVGNHSGGTLIVDSFVFAHAFYEHFGVERPFHQLAHDLVFQIPGVRASLARFGTVPAKPENAKRALERGAAVLVYPGGDYETFRPTWEGDVVDFDGRKGFVRQAIENDVPIVPVVAAGGQETALFLGRGQRLARLLALDRLARLKVLPVTIAPPTGIQVMELPLRVPLPSKIKIKVLPPIAFDEGTKPEDGYDIVVDGMQDALDDLSDERTLPIVG